MHTVLIFQVSSEHADMIDSHLRLISEYKFFVDFYSVSMRKHLILTTVAKLPSLPEMPKKFLPKTKRSEYRSQHQHFRTFFWKCQHFQCHYRFFPILFHDTKSVPSNHRLHIQAQLKLHLDFWYQSWTNQQQLFSSLIQFAGVRSAY